jgi:hypothetical protein
MTHQLARPIAPALYSQDGLRMNAIVHEHYFLSGSDWLITEYDPEDDLAFGWACLNGDRQSAELGYVSMAELESVQVPLRVSLGGDMGEQTLTLGNVGVERDEHWPPGMTLSAAIAELNARSGA